MINPLKVLKRLFSVNPIKTPGECIAESIANTKNAEAKINAEHYEALADYYRACQLYYSDVNLSLYDYCGRMARDYAQKAAELRKRKWSVVVNGETRVKGEEEKDEH